MTADPEVVAMLTSMGYSENQVSAALLATDNNIERYETNTSIYHVGRITEGYWELSFCSILYYL